MSIQIAAGKNTPGVNWDANTGIFTIEGKSFPENAKKFYGPLMDWMDQQQLPNKLVFRFYFFYLSSSSIISVYQILKKLEALMDEGTEVEIVWQYEADDDDILRIGEDYRKITSLPFVMKEEVD